MVYATPPIQLNRGSSMVDDIALSVRDLKTYLYTNNRCNKAINGVSFNVLKGKTLCIVGESGCGKSITALSIMQLLPDLSRIEDGGITYFSEKGPMRLDQLPRKGVEIRKIRGAEIAMIFQDPMTALNPVFTVGYQIAESLRQHSVLNDKEIKLKVIDLLHTMGIPMPEVRMNEFPHQFSGGMRQRVMIAIAMSCNPKVLIADEPTTALDVTTQAQIFTLMDKLKQEHKTAIMLITHDMGVVAELADNVAVMYMGNIVEAGTVEDVLRRPKHPYTRALLASIPILGRGRQQNIKAIRGSTPDSYDRPKGCSFAPRCDYATQACDEMPDEIYISATHSVRCSQLEAIS